MADPVFVDGVPPEKGDARSFGPIILGNADALRALNAPDRRVAFLLSNNGWYRRDTADTISADNGASVIRDFTGSRWKHVSIGIGSDLFDAYGETGSPSERDDYDAEDEGFTFYATDEEAWYVRVSGTPGTWAGPFEFQGPPGETGQRVRVASFISASPTAAELVLRIALADAVTFPEDLTGSVASAATAATGESVFSIQKNGVEFGTVTFEAAGTVGAFAADDPAEFSAGDVLSIIAPSPADDTLANISITVAASPVE